MGYSPSAQELPLSLHPALQNLQLPPTTPTIMQNCFSGPLRHGLAFLLVSPGVWVCLKIIKGVPGT